MTIARLIDADAIQYTHAIARYTEDGHNWNELCVTKEDIDAAPAVPAIPVEWLEDKELEYRTTGDKLMSDAFAVVFADWQNEQEARDEPKV